MSSAFQETLYFPCGYTIDEWHGKLPTVYAAHKKVWVWWQAIVQLKFLCVQITRKYVHCITHTMVPSYHITTRVWCQHHWTSQNTRKHFGSQFMKSHHTPSGESLLHVGQVIFPFVLFPSACTYWSRQTVLLLRVQIYCNDCRWAFKNCYVIPVRYISVLMWFDV
jgi:hypothetical protein